ncbi:MAG: PAS domain S-box protein [FCB group bacterium]|nr:PAS domain S-box protein [FCB group bacterium]
MRYLLLVTVILGLIFFTITYLGIKSARNSLLNIMVDEGKALTTSLTLSSTNAIQARLLLENLSEDMFNDLALLAEQRLDGVAEAGEYRRFREENSLMSVDILDPDLRIVGSDRWAEGFVPQYPPEVAAEVHDILTMGGGYRSVLIRGDEDQPLTQFFIYAFAPEGNLVIMSAEASYMEQIISQIGIGFLIRQISEQAGIDYILLQSRDGIILSSRSVDPVLAVGSDSFLESLMAVDTIGWRMHAFEDKQVLEIATRFESVVYPPGIYRIGMVLDDYHEIIHGFDRQIIIIAVILFFITFLVVAVVSVNQNYFILDRTYQQMRSMTETVFDRLTSAVMAYDREGKLIAVNDAFAYLTGITAESIGRKVSELSADLPFALPEKVTEGDRLISIEHNVITPGGEDKVILLGLSPLPDDAGGGAVALIHDITEQKRLEEDSRRRERLSEMGDMAAGVAHEIRNPLNAIAIAAQRLKHEFKPDGAATDFDRLSQNILDESARLNQILTRFLELARVRAGEKQKFDLAEPIGKAVSSLSAEAHEQGVELELEASDAAAVRGSAEKLQQVFINLIKNSMQAMHDGGRVIIAIAADNNGWRISVTDNGPGFPDDVLSKIFQPYFTTKADGSGLGLALAYKTIIDFGGRITASNVTSGGAAITILLPKA